MRIMSGSPVHFPFRSAYRPSRPAPLQRFNPFEAAIAAAIQSVPTLQHADAALASSGSGSIDDAVNFNCVKP